MVLTHRVIGLHAFRFNVAAIDLKIKGNERGAPVNEEKTMPENLLSFFAQLTLGNCNDIVCGTFFHIVTSIKPAQSVKM